MGPVDIHWLSPNVEIDGDELEALLSAEECAESAAYKSKPRRDEYRRSRFLIRRLTGWRGSLAKTAAGAPSWPDGLVGSLTHKDGFVGVAFAPAKALLGLGLDAEDTHRLKPAFEPKILNAAESALLDGLGRRYEARRLANLALIFSFKEALFKCHYPLGKKMFYFHDAEITRLDFESGQIEARVLTDTSAETPRDHVTRGHFRFIDVDHRQFVLSIASLPA